MGIVSIQSNKFTLTQRKSGFDANVIYNKPILSDYRNKQLFLWYCKKGYNHKVIICQESEISESFPYPDTSENTYDVVHINLHYKIQRIGFSETFYDIYEKEFHKISFLEKANGTFFI